MTTRQSAPPDRPAVSDRPGPTGGAHRWIDGDAWEDLYVVGDVHGCIDELRTLLDRLDPGGDDLVVFVGDLVRKGPARAAATAGVRDGHRGVPHVNPFPDESLGARIRDSAPPDELEE